MATGVGDIFLDLKLNKQPYEKGLSEAKSHAGVMGSTIGKALAGGIAGALAMVSFKGIIDKVSQIGDNIDKMSQKMGMSAKAYQEWDYVMQRCGASIDSMTMGMKTLASSAETGKEAFAELGISQAEIASLSQEQLFSRTISALQGVEDTTRRTYLAGQLLGRGATELGALLNMSAQDTTNLRYNLTALGGVMSQTAVTNSAQFVDALTDIRMGFRGIYNIVAEYVLPIVTSAINNYIIPAIIKACNVIRYFASLWSSIFGVLKKGANAIKGALGMKTAKQTDKTAKSIGGVNKGLGGTSKGAKKAKKAIKDLTRELMGFDKINKLQSKKSNGDGGGGGAGGGGGGGAGGFGDIGGLLDDGLLDENKPKRVGKFWKAVGEIGSAIIRLFKAVVTALKPVGQFLMKHLIKPLGKIAEIAVIAVLQGIAGAIELLARFVEKHPKIAVVLMGIGTALLAWKKSAFILGFLKKVGGLFAKLGSVIMAHPIIAILVGIALAVGYIYKNWDKIKKTKFGQILIKVGNTLKSIGIVLKDKVVSAFNKAKPVLIAVGNVLKKAFILYLKTIIARFKLFAKAVKLGWEVLKKFASFLSGKFKKGMGKAHEIVGKFKDAWSGIKNKTVSIVANAGEIASDIFDGISDKTVEFKAVVATKWEDIKSSWESLTGNIKDKTADMKAKVASAWSDLKTAWGNIVDNVKEKVADMKARVATTWNDIKKAWSNVVDNVKSKVVGMYATVKTTWNNIKDAWTNATKNVKSKTVGMYATVKTTWNDIKKKWNDVVGNIKDVKAKLSASIKLPKISWSQKTYKKGPVSIKYPWPTVKWAAQGAWIKKNTPQLIGVGDNRHESELVSPESKLEAMARQAAREASGAGNERVVELLVQLIGVVQGINPNVYLDGKEITQSTVKHINQQTRTTGKFPLVV